MSFLGSISKSNKPNVPLHLYGWCFFYLFYALVLVLFWGNVLAALTMAVVVVPMYGIISVFLRYSYAYFDVTSNLNVRQFLLLVILNSICGGLQLCYTEIIISFMEGNGIEMDGESRMWIRYLFHCFVFAIWSVAYLWVKADVYRNYESEERKKADEVAERAELQMLRYQLNPHFLFNCLNGIITEIQERPKLAVEMTHRLASYMRQSLDYRNDLIVSLDHEIDGVKMYLEIEQDRFGDDLKVFFDVPIDCSNIFVPVYLLQPVIENSIKHGMKSCPAPWQIRMEIQKNDDGIEIRIKNSGMLDVHEQGIIKGEESQTGVGLEVLKRRLMMHYPERHEFDLRQEEDFTVVEITLEGDPC